MVNLRLKEQRFKGRNMYSSNNGVEEFKCGLEIIMNVYEEWPTRPLGGYHSYAKEDAPFVIVIDEETVFPIYDDHPKYDEARVLGFTKEDYLGAKEIR